MALSIPQKVVAATKRLLEQDSSSVIRALLETSFWPRLLKSMEHQTRVSDDSSSELSVVFTPDGDGWIDVLTKPDPKEVTTVLRFRMPILGGGDSERVRNALLVLALAIKLDNEAKPQHHRRKIGDPPES
jgi:hypothetical protein